MTEIVDLADPPEDAAALLAGAAAQDFQLGAAWFATVAGHALPPGAAPLLLLHREAGRAVAMLALQRDAAGRLHALTSPYTTSFRPLLAADADAAAIRRAGRAFGAACRACGPLRLDALDAGWPGLPPLLAGLRAAGMLPLRFDHFGNWHADVAGLGWAGYLAGRPGALRETIRRRLARAEKTDAIGFELVADAAGLGPAVDAYDRMHKLSWKDPEPYPAFARAFLQAAAAAGVLRLGVLTRDGVPVAAQYWTVVAGVATLHKLAHDEAARALSPGTVLTALMLRHLLEREPVTALDFGRGDDPYKAGWTGQRRQRIGILACPPWRLAGLAALTRHLLGHAAGRWRRTRSEDGSQKRFVQVSDARLSSFIPAVVKPLQRFNRPDPGRPDSGP